MEIAFSFEELEIQKTARRFTRKDLLPVYRQIDDTGVIPDELQAKLDGLGLLKTAFPEPWGVGGTFTGLVLGLKEMAYATLLVPWTMFENHILAYAILNYGSDFLKEKYLADLVAMKTIGALAFTEADTGTDVAQLKTTAVKVDGGWVINGAKRFITNSGICHQMVLFARTGDKLTAFLVNRSDKGYVVGKREKYLCATMAHDNGDVYFEDYFAPDDHVIGRPGNGLEVLLGSEGVGKVVFCALYVGLAERAVDLSVDYATKKLHRGKPIGKKFQMIQYKLARMKTRLEAMKAYLWHVCAKVDRGENISAESATLKLLTGEDVKGITADAMEVHGAYGISEEYDVARLYRNAISSQVVMGGVLDVQRVIIAKSMLGRGH